MYKNHKSFEDVKAWQLGRNFKNKIYFYIILLFYFYSCPTNKPSLSFFPAWRVFLI